MNYNDYGFIQIKNSNKQFQYQLGLENYGFPYSEEYLMSVESEDIHKLTETYLMLSYMSGMEAEEKKENIFKRIWNWIVNKIKAVWNFFFGVKGKNEEVVAKKKIDENIQKLKSVSQSTDDDKPVEPTVSKKTFPEIKEDPKVKELKNELDILYKKYVEINKKHSDAQDEYKSAQSNASVVDADNKENKDKLNQYLRLFEENLIRKYEDEITELNKTIRSYKDYIAEVKNGNNERKVKAEMEYNKELKKKESELQSLQKDLSLKQQALEEEKKKSLEYQTDKSQTKISIQQLQESIKRYEKSNELTKQTISDLTQKHDTLQQRVNENKIKVQRLKAELTKLKDQELKSSQTAEDLKKQYDNIRKSSQVSTPKSLPKVSTSETKKIENEIITKTQDLAKRLNVKIPTEAEIMKRLKYSTNPADINNTKINNEYYLASGLDLFQGKSQEMYDPNELLNIESDIKKNMKNIHNNGMVTWISTDVIVAILEIDSLFSGLSNLIKIIIKPDNDDEDDVLDEINDYIDDFKKQEAKVKSILNPDKWICGLDTNNTEEVDLGSSFLQKVFHICFRIKALTNYDKILKELNGIKKIKPNTKPAYANTIKEFQTRVIPCFDKSVGYYKEFRSLFINLVSSDKLAQPYKGNTRFDIQVAKNTKDLYQTI